MAQKYITIADMQKLAKRRGGKCLSALYVNAATKLVWECAHSHQWEVAPARIIHRNAWCPVCAKAVQREWNISAFSIDR